MQLPKELQSGANLTRDLVFDAVRGSVDTDARTVELAFSSEAPVERWWGVEILDHNPKSIRLARVKRKAPVLVDHDSRDHVGVIESVQIGADKVARAVVRFGRSARANEVFQDIVDGIRCNVSVGYRIFEAVLEREQDGVSTYRITDWEPHEISLVSVPADTKVGVGRSTEIIASPPPLSETKTMDNPTTPAADHSAEISRATESGTRTGAEIERKRVSDILAIGDQYGGKHPAVRELAAEAARTGMSVDDFRARAMEKLTSAPKPTAEIGLGEKDVKRYSLVRAMNALANPSDARAQAAAAFEFECSAAAADKAGKAARGLMVPFDVLQRDLTKGTATAGGHLVETSLLSGSFIDMLRNAMVIDRLGTRMLTGLVGNIAIPRATGGGTAYWVAENVAVTESQQAFDQVTMSPKTVGAFTDISRKLLLQSSVDVENLVQSDLATILGLAIQSAAIQGGGAGEPTGILGTAGIGSVAGGANGLAPTWANIIALETAVAVANADVGTLAYLTNAKVRGKLKGTEKFGASNGAPVWGDGNTPLNGYATGVSNAVPSNLTKGTSAGVCSAIVFGNFADLLIGMWGGLDLLVDPYTGGAAGTVRLRVLQDVDVAVRHPESFAAMLDALTA